MKRNSTKPFSQHLNEQYGEKGTPGRDKFERGFQAFKLGILIQKARIKKGMTQEELAIKSGTNKGYISKLENDVNDLRISTLKRIVEEGLGGELKLSVKL